MRLLGRGREQRRVELAGAERQQHFLPDRVVEVLELERGLALVAEHLDDGRSAFIVHFHTRVVQANDVHLKSLHEEVMVVATTRTGQRHG